MEQAEQEPVARITAALLRLVASRHTGRVVITVDFREGGVRGASIAHVVSKELV